MDRLYHPALLLLPFLAASTALQFGGMSTGRALLRAAAATFKVAEGPVVVAAPQEKKRKLAPTTNEVAGAAQGGLPVKNDLAGAAQGGLPVNVVVVPDFDRARAELGRSEVNTVVVRGHAEAVPEAAWDSVAPLRELRFALPDPGAGEAAEALVRARLAASLRGLSEAHEASLSARVVALGAEFARCCGSRGVQVRLHVAALSDARNAQACPRYHVDRVPARLIATLAGRGTQVMPDDAVDNETPTPMTLLRDPDAPPYDARAGDALVLVGALGVGRHASVHRSPPVPPPCACCSNRRVVLVMDPLDDDAEAAADDDEKPPAGSTGPRDHAAAHILRNILA